MSPPFDSPPFFFADLEFQAEDVQLREFLAYWNSLRGDRVCPDAADFDPLDLAPHMGDMFIVNVIGDGEDFVYGLIGTRLTRALDRDSTGKSVATTFPPGHPIGPFYHHMWEQKAPGRTRGHMDWVDRRFNRFESLMLPMSDADGEVVKFIGEAIYSPDPDAKYRFALKEKNPGAKPGSEE